VVVPKPVTNPIFIHRSSRALFLSISKPELFVSDAVSQARVTELLFTLTEKDESSTGISATA
jgi:hypothetical protein